MITKEQSEVVWASAKEKRMMVHILWVTCVC